MSISFGMIVFGSMLIVAGWKNVSLSALSRGDNTTPKPFASGPDTPGGSGDFAPGSTSSGGGGNFPGEPRTHTVTHTQVVGP